MTREDDEWDDIVRNWQNSDLEIGDSTPAPTRHPSDQALEAKVKSAVKASLIETVLGVTVALMLGGYILNEIITGLPSALDYVLYSGIFVIVILVAFFSVWLRRGTWRTESKSTAAYLGLLIEQTNSAIKVIKMGKLFGVAMFSLFYGLAGFILVQMFRSENSLAKPGTASMIMGFVTLFFPGTVYFLHKQQGKFVARRQQLESMLKNLQ